MLEKNPDERFSVEEVINSRWMQGEIPSKEEIEEEAIYIVQSLASQFLDYQTMEIKEEMKANLEFVKGGSKGSNHNDPEIQKLIDKVRETGATVRKYQPFMH